LTQDVQFKLPNPISTTRLYRYVGNRVLISREGRAYRAAVCAILARSRCKPLTGPLAVEIDIHPPTHRSYDLDNRLKCLLDALQHGGAFLDDSQIDWVSARKCPPVKGGMAIVRIEETDGRLLPHSYRTRPCLPEVQPDLLLPGPG
jgi:crossover junction endodeoxyribonuclease RusA